MKSISEFFMTSFCKLRIVVPFYLKVLLSIIIVTGCQSDMPEDGTELFGEWRLVSIDDQASSERSGQSSQKAFIVQFGTNVLTGNTGVNNFYSEFRQEGNLLIINQFVISFVGESALGNQFFQALQRGYHEGDSAYRISYEIMERRGQSILVLKPNQGVKLYLIR